VEADLRTLFSQYGEVARVAVILDRETKLPRGFAFVTMPNDKEAEVAIGVTHGMEFQGQNLRVGKSLSTRGHTNYKSR